MRNTILCGDVREQLRLLEDESVNCVVTSPPYWGLRDYGAPGQIGLEATPEEYVASMVDVFREIRRVLRKDGTVWLNLGDSYTSMGRTGRKESPGVGAKQELRRVERDVVWAPRDEGDPDAHFRWTLPGGQKPKDLVGIPWRVAFALQADGWWLRSDIIWSKPNPMPESVTDRPTKAHEYVFLLAKGDWKSRVIQLANLRDERFHLGKNINASAADSWSSQLCVLYATSLFDSAQRQHDYGLPPFYAEIWKQGADDLYCNRVGCMPVVHRAAAIAATFLNAESTTKEFLTEIHRLWVTLGDGDNFLISGIPSVCLDSPAVYRDGDTSIAIYYSGQICKVNLATLHVTILSPSGCSYYYDAEAIKEPWTSGRNDMREKGVRTGLAYLQQEAITSNHAPSHKGSTFTNGKTGVNGQGRVSEAPREDNTNGRNKRSVWEVATHPFSEARLGLHGGAGGTGRIASPDCPMHGDQENRPSKEQRDAQRDAFLIGRNLRIESHHEQSPQDAPSPIGLPLFEGLIPASLDFSDRASVPTAIGRNTGTHKTVLAPETLPHDLRDERSEYHTGDNGPRLDASAMSDHTPESRSDLQTGEGEPEFDLSARIDGRNVHKCTCTIIDHFATFPEDLIKPCILAGTSEWGCCAECGAPWERVVERAGYDGAGRADTTVYTGAAYENPQSAPRGPKRNFGEPVATTTGWQSTCKHEAPTKPAVVLDPFFGSGTTGLVAAKAGRDWIGIELNPDYVALAEQQLQYVKDRLL